MNDEIAPKPTLDISHFIRNRLTSITLCANALQTDLAPKLSAEQERELRIIQTSVEEIKSALDNLTNSYCSEMLTLKRQQSAAEYIGSLHPAEAEIKLPPAPMGV